jgi:hypothetical protein
MKKYLTLFVLTVVLTLSISGCMRCQNNTVFTSPLVESFLGNYNFVMTDSTGVTILEGTMKPKIFEDPDFTGVFAVTKVIDARYTSVIPQGGKFSGVIDEKNKKAFINLNPRISDNNAFLRFDIKENELNGTWEKSTMMGIKEKGGFVATKVKE